MTTPFDANRVAPRLTVDPRAIQVPEKRVELFFVREFLGPSECAAICELIDQERRPSTIADSNGQEAFRTSETCDLDDNHPLVSSVNNTLSELTGIPEGLGEPIQGQRYAVGQEFKPHTDTFNPGGPDFYEHCADMGQRTWTAMLFLNEPEAGGATRFKTLKKNFQPETGKLLLWNNLKPDGRPNNSTLHQGMPVRKGTKYIITKWYRQLPSGA